MPKSSARKHLRHPASSILAALATGILLLVGAPALAQLTPGAVWSTAELDVTDSMDWGDWEGDGDLDLAVGNSGQPIRIYRNDNGSLNLAWSSAEENATASLAWGDWDGDGDMDLVAGNWGSVNYVYETDAGTMSIAWTSTEADFTTSVDWADVDGDLDLDLAVGNELEPTRLYLNVGGSLTLAWSSTEADDTQSVAWGDWDGDLDPDLAVGNVSLEPNRVYRNDGGSLTLAWTSPELASTNSVAWGDWDGDLDLDLACGNLAEGNQVYRNDGGSLTLAWTSAEADETYSLDWGDWDNDGDLDLATANGFLPTENRVYENDGGSPPNLAVAWSSLETDDSDVVAWGDVDNDGDLDLAVGNFGAGDQPNRIYRNDTINLAVSWGGFEAVRAEEGVYVRWLTLSEQDSFGFEVWARDAAGNGWKLPGFVFSRGPSWYEILDDSDAALSGAATAYRVIEQTFDGPGDRSDWFEVQGAGGERGIDAVSQPASCDSTIVPRKGRPRWLYVPRSHPRSHGGRSRRLP